MAEQFANEYATTLNGAINASQTSIVVTSATGAPAADFRLRIDDEYMLVTNKSGTTFTVTRAIEGSTGASHSNGAAVTHVLTAGGLVQGLADTFKLVGVQLERTTDLSVADNTQVDISWQSEIYDTHGFWSSGTAVTIPTGLGGTYDALVIGAWDSDPTAGYRQLAIRVTRSAVAWNIGHARTPSVTTGNPTVMSVAALGAQLQAGDVVEVTARHTAGNAIDFLASTAATKYYFTLRRVADAA